MQPVTLLILDGWGVAPLSEGNAIERARTPNLSQFLLHYPAASLHASGEAVGLPYGEMGNSEVGHLTIGLGRIYYQPLPRINHAIHSKNFFNNEVLLSSLAMASQRGSRLHLVGLVSTGGVHSTIEHLYALLEMAQAQHVHRVFVHAIMDGRDSPFNSGMQFVERIQERLALFAHGTIASISGRFWAMDRDHHWDRTQAAFQAMAHGRSLHTYRSALTAIQWYYNTAVYDEMIPPTVISDGDGKPQAMMEPDDVVILFNFRPDRMRQLTTALKSPTFTQWDRELYVPPTVATFTEYDPALECLVAFPNERTDATLAETVSAAGCSQLHVAETEKYAHITYFLNGYRESPFEREERILVPSPRAASYRDEPAMSTRELTTTVLEYWKTHRVPELTVINFANVDMVGHTGDFEAVRLAVEIVDELIGVIAGTVLNHQGVLVITADHGNAEEMIDRGTGRFKTSHTANPVPLYVVARRWEQYGSGKALSIAQPIGGLLDVAPTILAILGLPAPSLMTGTNLIPLLIDRHV